VRSRALLAFSVLLLAAVVPASADSGLQITPDGKRTLVTKDVGAERWAIVRSTGVDDVSGNVYFPDGSDPQFVYCTQTGTSGGNLELACSGADRCTSAPCTASEWSSLGDVTLPESFFEPDIAPQAAARVAAAGSISADGAGSGMQQTPAGATTLVNKDLDGERWAIARFADEVVTGIVYRGESAEPSFVYCTQTGRSGTNLELACSGADSCKTGPCTADQWTSLGDVTIPESFFAPPPVEEISPDNAASLELAWDFQVSGGVTASPVVSGDLVYFGSWNATLYAVDRKTGALRWTFDTVTGGIGIQATVTLVPDSNDILLGDSLSYVYRLDGRTGELKWKTLIGDIAADHIWSGVTVAKGRIFVGIASHSDNPCTNGRTSALDLESGELLWERQNVPARVCRTDTSIVCEDSSDCPESGECVRGVGAGVTAQPLTDATGDFVYVNAVGCYTSPSIGDSDSIMKLDAKTGATEWLTRVQPPEQFGFCAGDSSIDCGTDAMCGGKGPCQKKGAYHDFGFLNGPLLLQVKDDRGRNQSILVSGSKDGTLYAVRESDGELYWKNVVEKTPVSPGFAGFGLFNGAVAYDNGFLYAALFHTIPPANPEPPHLMSFDPSDGSIVWTSEIGPAYSSVGVHNGVLFTGTNDVAELYVYDATKGERLKTFELPATTSSKAAIVGDTAYVGYGIISGVGGVRAYRLP
jgi:outer membrane protein assembly factor BamB